MLQNINLMPLAIVLIALLLQTAAKSLPNDFMLLGLTPTTQLINGLTCESYRPYLGSNTDYLCSKIPELHVLLHRSNVQARQQCEYHFRDHPWGCRFSSNLTPLRRFLRQTSKEASFYTTLASASLTWTLVNACLNGQINDTQCQCSGPRSICQINPNGTFEFASLVTDGLNMSHSFQQKLLFKINQANKELGRQIVQESVQKECRCHGVSGSCELQICRYRPKKFSIISDTIYTSMYRNAERVETLEQIKMKTKQMIYGRRSINYCRSNTYLDYSGVASGRECFSIEGCETTCCQRGYQVLTETKRIDHCHCYFSWSIVNVQCQPCEKKVTRMMCN